MANFSQVLLALFLAISSFGYSRAAWCVCKDGLSDTVLQGTLDYACGAGADCSPIRPSGSCYSPTSVKAHCSYAVNSYFQKKGQASTACSFSGTAAVTASNPSTNGCTYPASASGTGSTGTTPSTTPTTSPVGGGTTTGTPVSGGVGSGSPKVSGTGTSTPTTSSPYTTTVQPSTTTSSSYPNGITGTGIAPTGDGMNDNRAGTLSPPPATAFCWVLVALLVLLRNY